MGAHPVVYDLTIFDADGVPWFGEADSSGEVVESDFQTPDTDLAHDRPYLLVPGGFSPTEVDFLQGSSRIGTVSVGVLDKRLTASDQRTGIVTSKVADAPRLRAVLRRWVESEWVKLFDGVVQSVSVDTERLVVYHFHLRDGREYERDQGLFFSNYVLIGANGATGPAINYGQLPGLGPIFPYLVPMVLPFSSISQGNIDHFERLSDVAPADGIHWGVAALGTFTASLGAGTIPVLPAPVQDPDGVFRYREFRIEWRAKASFDDWTVLRAMPREEFAEAIARPATGVIDGVFFGVASLYFGSTVSADIPTTGQEIEFRVIAERITPETPFFWDGGTLGDLLQEIADGEHTEEPPRERYNAAALAAFAEESPPARFILREPVTDRRRWVEEHVYKPDARAPAFGVDLEIAPVSWRVPTAAELASAPTLDMATLQPIGEWEHGSADAVGAVEFTYIRERLDNPYAHLSTFSQELKGYDPSTPRWLQLVEEEILVRIENPDALPGAITLSFAPVTIRSTADVDGVPIGGDAQDELGYLVAHRMANDVFSRWGPGRPKYIAEVIATPENLNLKAGDWVKVDAPWLPNLSTGIRE